MIQFGWYFVLAVQEGYPYELIGHPFHVTPTLLKIVYSGSKPVPPLKDTIRDCGLIQGESTYVSFAHLKELFYARVLRLDYNIPFTLNYDRVFNLADVAAARAYMKEDLYDLVLKGPRHKEEKP